MLEQGEEGEGRKALEGEGEAEDQSIVWRVGYYSNWNLAWENTFQSLDLWVQDKALEIQGVIDSSFFFFIKKFPWGQDEKKEMRPEVRMQGEGSHIITWTGS